MALIDLIAGAMVTTGASLMLIGVIGLVLTRSEEREVSGDGLPQSRQAVTAPSGREPFGGMKGDKP